MMRVAIIALLISLAALGLGAFATVRTFNESHPAPQAESQWSEEECAANRETLELGPGSLKLACFSGDCDAYSDMLQAIADNCP